MGAPGRAMPDRRPLGPREEVPPQEEPGVKLFLVKLFERTRPGSPADVAE